MMAAHDHDPVDLVLERLRSAGCNPRSSGPAAWSAKCPNLDAHKGGDRNPSLSVGSSPTGNALVYCHRGCTVVEVAKALRMDMTDLFPPKPPKVAHIDGIGRQKAIYPYYDADGELLYEVVRYERLEGGKTFRQRRPDGMGGWVGNISGIDRVLYHLPQVRRAVENGDPIWIVEGEKDVENLQWAVAGVVTCNSGGAGSWKDTHTLALIGAGDVTIVADDDDTGHNHAQAVADAIRPHVRSVTVKLPAKGHKDVSQMLGAGLTMDALRPFDIDEADEATADPEPTTYPLELVDWSTFWTRDLNAATWIAEPMIAQGRGHAIFAPGGTGKSLLGLCIAAAVATGRAILNKPSGVRRHVLYLDYEMTDLDLQERLDAMGYGPDTDLSHLHYALLPNLPPLDTREGAIALVGVADAVEAELVVIDTFGRAVAGEENDADTVRNYYRLTGMALKARGVASLRIDHAGKDVGKGQRGSSAKNDDVDVVWELRKADGGFIAVAKKRRMGWIPETVAISQADGADGVLTFTCQDTVWPTGTMQTAAWMDAADVPLSASVRVALATLRLAEDTRPALAQTTTAVVGAALKYRHHRAAKAVDKWAQDSRNTPRNAQTFDGSKHLPKHPGDPLKTQGETPAETPRNSGHGPAETFPPPRGETVAPPPRPTLDDLDW